MEWVVAVCFGRSISLGNQYVWLDERCEAPLHLIFACFAGKRIIETQVDAILLSFPNAVNVYKPLIDLIRAFKHDTGVVHVVPLPVAQLRVRASFLQV